MKAMDRLEDTIYAVKKVRLHLPLCDDLRTELKNHKVFREVKALASSTTQELKHTVRYFNSWLEDLTPTEVEEEKELLSKYAGRKRLSSINENEELSGKKSSQKSSDSLTGNSKSSRRQAQTDDDEINSDDYYDEESECITKTGDLDSRHSIVRLTEAERGYLSVNLYM